VTQSQDELMSIGATIEDFWRIATRGSHTDMQSFLKVVGSPNRSAAITFAAQGMDAIFGGDVSSGAQLMERAIRVATPEESEYIVDIVLPIHTSRGDFEVARAHLDCCEGRVACLVPSFIAFRALLEGERGKAADSRKHAAEALSLLNSFDDPLLRGKTLNRTAMAAYFRWDFDEAYEHGLQAAKAHLAGSSHRNVAIVYSMLYTIAAAHYQDEERATYLAIEGRKHARLAGDVALENNFLVKELGIALCAADAVRVESLLAAYDCGSLGPQFSGESFGIYLVRAVRHGWQKRFDAVGPVLKTMRDNPNLSLAEKSLCDVLEALVCVASSDLGRARALLRLALSQTISPHRSERINDAFFRRGARTLAALACICIGDVVRGWTVLKSRESLARFRDLAELVGVSGLDEDIVQPMLRGYVRFLNAALATARAERPRVNLTDAEFDVLRALWDGSTVVGVARALGKSPKTVRCQLSSIYQKLEATNRIQALRRAAELGLAPQMR
jgi:DNA-binding CsgD family transcriptional regulator